MYVSSFHLVFFRPSQRCCRLAGLDEDTTSDVARAIKAIRAGEVKVKDDSLVLAVGMKWPCATNNVLFLRKYYEPMFNEVLRRGMPVAATDNPPPRWRQVTGNERIVITGQPGIGKSVFGFAHVVF